MMNMWVTKMFPSFLFFLMQIWPYKMTKIVLKIWQNRVLWKSLAKKNKKAKTKTKKVHIRLQNCEQWSRLSNHRAVCACPLEALATNPARASSVNQKHWFVQNIYTQVFVITCKLKNACRCVWNSFADNDIYLCHSMPGMYSCFLFVCFQGVG